MIYYNAENFTMDKLRLLETLGNLRKRLAQWWRSAFVMQNVVAIHLIVLGLAVFLRPGTGPVGFAARMLHIDSELLGAALLVVGTFFLSRPHSRLLLAWSMVPLHLYGISSTIWVITDHSQPFTAPIWVVTVILVVMACVQEQDHVV